MTSPLALQSDPVPLDLDLEVLRSHRSSLARAGDPAPLYRSHWHDDIIEWIVTHPGRPLTECARDLGRHHLYIQMLMRSDAMKLRLERRRLEIREATNEKLLKKAADAAEAGLDILGERFADRSRRDAIPTAVVAETTRDLLSVLGFAPKRVGDEPPSQVTVTVAVGADLLAAARDRMKTIEGTLVPPKPTSDLSIPTSRASSQDGE